MHQYKFEQCDNHETVRTRTIDIQWISPPKGTFMISCDGSYGWNRGGCGGIIREIDGTLIGAYVAAVAPISVLFHELQVKGFTNCK